MRRPKESDCEKQSRSSKRLDQAIGDYLRLGIESRRQIIERCAELPGAFRVERPDPSMHPTQVFGVPMATGYFARLVRDALGKEAKIKRAAELLLSPTGAPKAKKHYSPSKGGKAKGSGRGGPKLIYTPVLGQPRNKRTK